MKSNSVIRSKEIRRRLVELGGAMAQELGLGRIPGFVLTFLYFSPGECSLDQIERELGLSKAAVSVATRELERWGLIQRVYKRGERKGFYKTADHLAEALQEGVVSVLRRRLAAMGDELERLLELFAEQKTVDSECRFLQDRIRRAHELCQRVNEVLQSPLIQFLAR